MHASRSSLSGRVVEYRSTLRSHAAYSLIELLVVISIIALLGAVLLSAVSGVREHARMLQCTSNMRNIAVDFQSFVLRENPEGRGDSEYLGRNRFQVNDFQDLLYNLDEFWDQGDSVTSSVSRTDSPMLCPSVRTELTKRSGYPCGRNALQPVGSVSIALNMRLYRGVLDLNDRRVLAPVALTFLTERVLDQPYAPLALDVDGQAAVEANHDPFYIAPGIPGEDDPYSSNRFWFPSNRHLGDTLIAYIGGHVQRVSDPAEESWAWRHAASVGR